MANIIDFFHEREVLTRDFLHQKYTLEGLSCAEISKLVASSRTTILKRLKECGVPIRKVGTNQRRKRGIAFGQKIVDRKLKADKKEQELIRKISELRNCGYSYNSIASILTSMGFKTKNKGGKWHGKTVYCIIQRNKIIS
ncbi:MAG: hypothetical protein COW00_13595 [Bdellovibrio sp. CG12_big_fil_rev_8_21_14_0_65_39_13]|nr:MAG: hypothetical protein COW78_07020 [Bdellovibrio sp. CG22_combo_CG10-13_8_21_14_all_39_27]PIQ58650.1 MAG: hypothetical protein COW00_13595 [Bdellovibrio sp. CG12_big_fil_rev_8_21_14_0_65_39_13]PIR33025.1 MAG: hypothetical protein COV37_18190 [Bdellovibrio sp. CG11_big_fil_rev_8_21_14_0_20_39_38]